MERRRILFISGLLGSMIALQVVCVLTRHEVWPFSPIEMYSSTQGLDYSGRNLVVTEVDGSRLVLGGKQAFGRFERPFVTRVVLGNPKNRRTLEWAAELYAEQRRLEGRPLPKRFALANVTWRLRPGGSMDLPPKRIQTIASYTY